MTFFLIVPSVMIISTFLVHAVCNRLGLRIHFITLIMCAFLAIAADLGAIALSDIPNKFYFIKLGGIIAAAAGIVTATNYFLVKRELEEEAEFSEQVKLAYQKKSEILSDEETDAGETFETKDIQSVEEKVIEPEIKSVEKIEIKPESKVEVEDKIVDKVEITPLKKVELTKPEKIQSPEKIEVKPDAKVEVKPLSKIEQPKKTEFPKPAPKVENVPPLNIEVKGDTLDDILDYAYLEKQQGHTWQAIAAYKKALEKYRNDEYAPFVAIDLGNIYKEQAFYTKAIKTYEDALELPAVKRSATNKAEFRKNLIYLKTVQSVLLRHKALSTPFSKISRAYLLEIESEFQKAQLKFEDH